MYRALERCAWLGMVLTAMFVAPSVWAAQPVQVMLPGSYAQLLARQGDAEFILGFWSLDCPPCYRELALWGEQQRTGSALPLVLISTDAVGDAEEIRALLAQHGLQDVEAWVFGAPAQQLRFEVDRHWQGELPRTYLIGKGKVIDAVSGVVDAERLARWRRRAP